jgi:hypothetical protein
VLDKMAADETGAAGDEDPHGGVGDSVFRLEKRERGGAWRLVLSLLPKHSFSKKPKHWPSAG